MTFTPAAVAGCPQRHLNGRFWHQGQTRRALTSFADPAVTDGRYHHGGGPGVWYASDQEQGAWAELLRHFVDEGIDPFEVRRRVGAVDVNGLAVLDLTDPAVCASLGVTEADLTGDDYSKSQAIADKAFAVGFGGVLAPAAALPGRRTLAMFTTGQGDIAEVSSRVRRPPPRLANVLDRIRPHPDVPAAVRQLFRELRLAGAEAIRRQRSR